MPHRCVDSVDDLTPSDSRPGDSERRGPETEDTLYFAEVKFRYAGTVSPAEAADKRVQYSRRQITVNP